MTVKIAVIPGDGIGKEVTAQSVKVLNLFNSLGHTDFEIEQFDLGTDRYLKHQELLPQNVLNQLETFDAILVGALGDFRVKAGIIEKGILLKLRFYFDQYVNIRPIKLFENKRSILKNKGTEDIDFTIIRENSEGIYAGIGGVLKEGTSDEIATQEMIATYKGVARIIRYAFEYTQKLGQKSKLTICDKSNVLTYAHGLWQRVFQQMATEYEDIVTDHYYIDAITMKMVANPEIFDVIVTCNMFGDILSDLGAELQGGIGLSASANINPQGLSMFEPVHGSAPDIAGQNIASPLASVLASAMMLKHLSYQDLGLKVEAAVRETLALGLTTKDLGGQLSTTEVGDELVKILKNKGAKK